MPTKKDTVEPPLTVTSPQWLPLYSGHLCTVASSLQQPPLYSGHLCTVATSVQWPTVHSSHLSSTTTQPLALLFPNHVQFFCSPFYALSVQRNRQESRTLSKPRESSDTFVLCIPHPTCLTDKLTCIL